jgi:hypothetical protein
MNVSHFEQTVNRSWDRDRFATRVWLISALSVADYLASVPRKVNKEHNSTNIETFPILKRRAALIALRLPLSSRSLFLSLFVPGVLSFHISFLIKFFLLEAKDSTTSVRIILVCQSTAIGNNKKTVYIRKAKITSFLSAPLIR